MCLFLPSQSNGALCNAKVFFIMKKVLRVKDLFNQVDEKFGIRMSEVSLAKFLPSSYQYALIERNSSNRCCIYLKKFSDSLPCLHCKISYNAPLSSISACCFDFKLV